MPFDPTMTLDCRASLAMTQGGDDDEGVWRVVPHPGGEFCIVISLFPDLATPQTRARHLDLEPSLEYRLHLQQISAEHLQPH